MYILDLIGNTVHMKPRSMPLDRAEVQGLLNAALRQERRRNFVLLLGIVLLNVAFIWNSSPLQSILTIPDNGLLTENAQMTMGRSLLQKKNKKAKDALEEFTYISSSPAAEIPAEPLEEVQQPAPQPLTPAVICDCPPPPPAFLSEVFGWDPRTRKLTVNAATVETQGSLVIRSYLGVGSSIFVGGDPSNGESASELGAGNLLLYSPDGGSITGFETSSEGFQIANVTITGRLFVDDYEGAGPQQVGAPATVQASSTRG